MTEMLTIEAFDSLAEFDLCKAIGDALHSFYPGHIWAVSMRGKALYVQNMALNGKWGFVLHPHLMDDLKREAMLCGGELLERYNISRGAPGVQQALNHLRSHPISR